MEPVTTGILRESLLEPRPGRSGRCGATWAGHHKDLGLGPDGVWRAANHALQPDRPLPVHPGADLPLAAEQIPFTIVSVDLGEALAQLAVSPTVKHACCRTAGVALVAMDLTRCVLLASAQDPVTDHGQALVSVEIRVPWRRVREQVLEGVVKAFLLPSSEHRAPNVDSEPRTDPSKSSLAWEYGYSRGRIRSDRRFAARNRRSLPLALSLAGPSMAACRDVGQLVSKG